MMRNYFLSFIGAFFLLTQSFGQTLPEADNYFSYFEYAKAAEIYEVQPLTSLNQQQKENLAISYYYTFNGAKGLAITDDLIKSKPNESKYWLWKARFLKETSDFENAKAAALNYRKLGGKESVDLFVQSCDLWLSNNTEIKGTLSNNPLNDFKANSILQLDNEWLFFKETGLDVNLSQLELNVSAELAAEVLLMTPYVLKDGKLQEWKLINEPGKFFSVNSIQVDKKNKKAYFSASQPLENDVYQNRYHIYEGEFNGFDVALSNIQPWKYSGFEDSSTCAQLALSQDSKMMVFSKLGDRTENVDLYYSKSENGSWSKPKSLSKLNTAMDELFPVFSGDSLFSFASNGRIGYGELDLYSVPLTGQLEDLREVYHLPLPINSSADDFNYLFTSQDTVAFVSNRRSGKGDDDVWQFAHEIIIPILEPIVEVVKPLNIDSLLNAWSKERVHAEFDKEATFEDFTYLNELKKLMADGYKFHIDVIGSTDNRGSVNYNKSLGMRRATMRREELIQVGFPSEIMEVKSIGATEPVSKCPNGTKCPESVHQQNRYVRLNITQIKE